MNITLTTSAAEQILSLTEAQGEGFTGVRLMIQGGGCSGMQYAFNFVVEPDEDDLRFEKDGATLVVDPLSIMHLDGSTLDYTESIAGSQFVIKNPAVKTQCGCGNSFST